MSGPRYDLRWFRRRYTSATGIVPNADWTIFEINSRLRGLQKDSDPPSAAPVMTHVYRNSAEGYQWMGSSICQLVRSIRHVVGEEVGIITRRRPGPEDFHDVAIVEGAGNTRPFGVIEPLKEFTQ